MAQLTWNELKDNLRQKFPTVVITAEQLSECLQELDAVSVVRCKDCKWWTKQSDSPQGRCELFHHYPTGGWYCANGRREDETC